jgi:cephalosporin hydroxylase
MKTPAPALFTALVLFRGGEQTLLTILAVDDGTTTVAITGLDELCLRSEDRLRLKATPVKPPVSAELEPLDEIINQSPAPELVIRCHHGAGVRTGLTGDAAGTGIGAAGPSPVVHVLVSPGLWAEAYPPHALTVDDEAATIRLRADRAAVERWRTGADGAGAASAANSSGQARVCVAFPALRGADAAETASATEACVGMASIIPPPVPGHSGAGAGAAEGFAPVFLDPLQIAVSQSNMQPQPRGGGGAGARALVPMWALLHMGVDSQPQLPAARLPVLLPRFAAPLPEPPSAGQPRAGASTLACTSCAEDDTSVHCCQQGQGPTGTPSSSSAVVSAEVSAAVKQRDLLDDFERMFERDGLWGKMTWLGVEFEQNPNDAVVIQEILFETRPDLIIETGSHNGGSALFFLHVMQNIDPECHVVSMDVTDLTGHIPVRFPWTKGKVTFLKGSSVSDRIAARVAEIVRQRRPKRVLVSLDSEHFSALVLRELELYAPFVTEGSYTIVQDTRLSNPRIRHPRYCAQGSLGGPCNGPLEAVHEFLRRDQAGAEAELVFRTDSSREYLRYTNHPGGYLKRGRR